MGDALTKAAVPERRCKGTDHVPFSKIIHGYERDF